MRQPRYFAGPGQPVEVVRKCTDDRFLLKPDSDLRARMIGVYARAQELYGMTVYAVVALSNHTQDLIAPESPDQRTNWLRYTGTNLSKLVKRRRSWRAPVFSRRASVIPLTDEPGSFVERFKYILAHGLKESLVPHPGLWLGMECVSALCAGRLELDGLWCDHSAHARALAAWRRERRRLQTLGSRCRSRRPRPEDFERKVSLKLSKPPELAHLSDAGYCEWVRGLVEDLLEDYAEQREKVPKNWREVLHRLSFAARPRTVARRRPPICHAASREGRVRFGTRWREWVGAYRRASHAYRQGLVRDVGQFPLGAIPPALSGFRVSEAATAE